MKVRAHKGGILTLKIDTVLGNLGVPWRSRELTRNSFEHVLVQDFSKPWTDAVLYKEYELDENEIAFIESNIKSIADAFRLRLLHRQRKGVIPVAVSGNRFLRILGGVRGSLNLGKYGLDFTRRLADLSEIVQIRRLDHHPSFLNSQRTTAPSESFTKSCSAIENEGMFQEVAK